MKNITTTVLLLLGTLLVSVPVSAADGCPSGYYAWTSSDASQSTPSCIVSTLTAAASDSGTVQLDADSLAFSSEHSGGQVHLTLTTIQFPITTWKSTRLTFDGEEGVCVDHDNYSIRGTKTFEKDMSLPTNEALAPGGRYVVSAQAFVDDACTGTLTSETSETVRIPKHCLNCIEETLPHTEDTSSVQSNNTSRALREARKEKIDALITGFRNEPNFEDILFVIDVLILLDIIPV